MDMNILSLLLQGVASEFHIPHSKDPKEVKYQFQWRYINGVLGVIFTFGVLLTALKSHKARSWLYGTGRFRSFIADYGVPAMVVVWTALSFAVPKRAPSGVPRRLDSPMPWEPESLYHWTVAKVKHTFTNTSIVAVFCHRLRIRNNNLSKCRT